MSQELIKCNVQHCNDTAVTHIGEKPLRIHFCPKHFSEYEQSKK